MSKLGILFVILGVAAMTLFSSHLFAQKNELVVIELYARTADEVIPLLKPMLAPGGTIAGLKDKLILRTTPANHAELRKMLDIIDARPRRLLITVRRDTGALREDREVGISGSVGNDNVRVTIPDTDGEPSSADSNSANANSREQENRVEVRARSDRSNRSGRSVQTVQVLEGNGAFIGTGESIPIRGRTTIDGPSSRETIGFQEAVSGFYAKPRIQGNRVTVQLAAAADTVLDRRTGATHIQRVTSVVSGRIGEWIEVGGISEHGNETRAEIASRGSSESRDQGRIYIKVDEIR